MAKVHPNSRLAELLPWKPCCCARTRRASRRVKIAIIVNAN